MTLQWILGSCVLILAVVTMNRLSGSRVSARLRYALWLVVLVRLLIPVQLFSASVAFVPQLQVAEKLEEKSIYVIPTGSADVKDAAELGAYITDTGEVEMFASMGYARLEEDGEAVVRYLDKVSPMDLFKTVWTAGCILMLVVILSSNLHFSRHLKALRALLDAGESKLPVYRVEGLSGPCLFGLLHPVIYVTDDVMADESILRHILAHEMTHYRHGDHIWSALRSIALALHWWNPLVWLAVVLSRRDGELACDEGALLRLGDIERKAYGETLLQLVTAPAKPADLLHCTTTMTGGMKEIKQRIESIICKRKHLVTLSAAMVITLSVLAACSFAAQKDENAVSTEARRVIEVMMNAPNEDLVYYAAYQLNSNPTEAEEAAWEAEKNRVEQNWEKAVGKYFEEGSVSNGVADNSLKAFQTRSRDFGKTCKVTDMVVIFKDESREEIEVTYTADDEEHRILVILHIGPNGKFQQVAYQYTDESADLPNIMMVIAGSPHEPDEMEAVIAEDTVSNDSRLNVLGENDEIWITMTERTTSQGNGAGSAANMELTVYTQEGTFVQNISYLLALGKDVHLTDIVRSPADYLTLEDVNGDGTDDIKVVTATQSNEEKLYRCFIWDPAAKQFMEET